MTTAHIQKERSREMNKEEALQKIKEMESDIKELEEFVKQQDNKEEMFPRVEHGGSYFTSSCIGARCWIEDDTPHGRIMHASNNYYLTREEAEEQSRYGKARRKLQKIAKYYNQDWKPAWNGSESKYYLAFFGIGAYDYGVQRLVHLNNGAVYFKNRESADKALELLTEDEKKILFRRGE
jgi:hypothetical protein